MSWKVLIEEFILLRIFYNKSIITSIIKMDTIYFSTYVVPGIELFGFIYYLNVLFHCLLHLQIFVSLAQLFFIK